MLQDVEDDMNKLAELTKHKKPLTKSNYVGIEIEFLIPDNKETELENALVKANLHKNVNLGQDSSVEDEDSEDREYNDDQIVELWRKVRKKNSSGRWYPALYEVLDYPEEYDDSPVFIGKELRLLAKEEEAPELIDSVCSILKKMGCKVNHTCGLHVHLDMRQRDLDLCYYNLVESQDLLFKMNPKERETCGYCYRSTAFNSDDRYTAINRTAYNKHKTIEVRLHEGTIEAIEIKTWVGLLINIANRKEKFSSPISRISQLSVPLKVQGYVNARIKKYRSK